MSPSRRTRLQLRPAVLRWARERAGLDPAQLASKLKVASEAVDDWERSGEISVARADKLAQHTHTPVGYLYLPEPPDERLPIADFRTRSGDALEHPSPDLLETVYSMQRRQLWMRDELIEEGAEPVGFVGRQAARPEPQEVAASMAAVLELRSGWAASEGTWSDALANLRNRVESAGVLLVFSGVVGNNTRRKLDAEEFQGFALVDDYAPLIFVNSADFKSAQIFTLVHELAHICVGDSGVSRFRNLELETDHSTEVLCNASAAEFLIPEDELRGFWRSASRDPNPYRSIARHFKVSALVAARRALDTRLITRSEFLTFYEEGQDVDWGLLRAAGDGGSFWNTQRWRIGTRFGGAVYRAVKEGRLSYRDAYSLTGLGGRSFEDMPQRLGIDL